VPTQWRLVQNDGEICEEVLEKGPTAFQNELKTVCAPATITPPPPPTHSSRAAFLASLLHSKYSHLGPFLLCGRKSPDRFVASPCAK
jgi:hypothetical protein